MQPYAQQAIDQFGIGAQVMTIASPYSLSSLDDDDPISKLERSFNLLFDQNDRHLPGLRKLCYRRH